MNQENSSTKEPYIYINLKNEYLIGDLGVCEKSERTIDLSLHELAANHKGVLDSLNLVSMYVGTKHEVTRFVSYLHAFSQNENGRERLLNNPALRILVLNPSRLKHINSKN